MTLTMAAVVALGFATGAAGKAKSVSLELEVVEPTKWTFTSRVVFDGAARPQGLSLSGAGRNLTVRVTSGGNTRVLTPEDGVFSSGPLGPGDSVEVEERRSLTPPPGQAGHVQHLPLRDVAFGVSVDVTLRWPAAARCGAGLTGGALPPPTLEGAARVTRARVPVEQLRGARAALAVSCGLSWNEVARLRPLDFTLPTELAKRAAQAAAESSDLDKRLDWAIRTIGSSGPHVDKTLTSTRPLMELAGSPVASEEEQARYFAALLRGLSIPAVLAAVGSDYPLLDAVPLAEPRSRYVVHLPVQDQWFEMGHAPRRLCSSNLARKRALLLTPETKGLVDTGKPVAASGAVELVVNGGAPGRGFESLDVSIQASGCLADLAEPSELAFNTQKRLGGVAKVLESSRDELGNARVRLRVTAPASFLGVTEGSVPIRYWPTTWLPLPLSMLAWGDELPDLSLTSRTRLALPEGYVLEDVRRGESTPWFEWAETSSRDAAGVVVETKWRTLVREIPASARAEASAAAQRFLAAPSVAAVTEEVGSLVQHGEWTRAFELANARGPLALSRVALAAGLRDEAIRQARSATTREPKSAAAALQLAAALAMDAPGEAAAAHRADVLGAARRALRLDPGSLDARLQLIDWLTVLPPRARAPSKRDVEEAVALWKQMGSLSYLRDATLHRLLWEGDQLETLASSKCEDAACRPLVEAAHAVLGRLSRPPSTEALEALASARRYDTLAITAKAFALELAPDLRAAARRLRHEEASFARTDEVEVTTEVLAHAWGAATRVRPEVVGFTGQAAPVTRADWRLDLFHAGPVKAEHLSQGEVLVTFGRERVYAALLEESGSRLRLHPVLGPSRLGEHLLTVLLDNDLPRLRGALLADGALTGKWYADFQASDAGVSEQALWRLLELPPPPNARARARRLSSLLAERKQSNALEVLSRVQAAWGFVEDALETVRAMGEPLKRVRREVELLLVLKRQEEAKRVVADLRKVSGEQPAILDAAATLLALEGDLPGADELWRAQKSADALHALAWAHARAGAVDERSVAAAREAARAFPEERAVLGTLALTEALAGHVTEALGALAQYRKASRLPGQPSQEVEVAQALIALHVGFKAEARRQLAAIRPLPTGFGPSDELMPLVQAQLKALR
ncbi:MAG: hypothetical protein AB1938_20355 [Myxococcota bacterium]